MNFNINIGSWNVGGFADYLAQDKRSEKPQLDKVGTGKGDEEDRKIINQKRAEVIVKVIREELKASPIICLQEVDDEACQALIAANIGIIWDGHDSAIAFDKSRIDGCKTVEMIETEPENFLIVDFSIDGKIIRVASKHLPACDPFNSDGEDFNKKKNVAEPTQGLEHLIILTKTLDNVKELHGKPDLEVIGMDANVAMKQDNGEFPLRLKHAKEKEFVFDEEADNPTVWNRFYDNMAKSDESYKARIYHRCDYVMAKGSGGITPIVKEIFKTTYDLQKPNIKLTPSDHRPIRVKITVKKPKPASEGIFSKLKKALFKKTGVGEVKATEDVETFVKNHAVLEPVVLKEKQYAIVDQGGNYVLKYIWRDGTPYSVPFKIEDGKLIVSSKFSSTQYDNFDALLKGKGLKGYTQFK